MILVAHIETSGLLRRDLPPDDPAQPFILDMAAELVDAAGATLDFISTRVRAPEGRKVQEGATKVHGITSREAARAGVNEIAALGVLCGLASQAAYFVSFSGFERDVAVSRLMTLKKSPALLTRPGLEFIPLRATAALFCKITSDPPRDDGQYMWPSLDVACEKLLGEPIGTAPHRAWPDLQQAKRLFLHLKAERAFEIAA